MIDNSKGCILTLVVAKLNFKNMRKLTLTLACIFTLAAVLTSCHKPTQEQIEKYRQQENDRITSHFYKINYEGHTYIFYQYATQTQSQAALTHDPNCACQNHEAHE